MGTAAVDLSRMVLLGKEKFWDFENTRYIGLQKTYSEIFLQRIQQLRQLPFQAVIKPPTAFWELLATQQPPKAF